MALTPVTPRDKLQQIVDLGRKAIRYWWLISLCVVAGGTLALAFAVFRTKNYVSWSTLFYQERIQTQVMTPMREEIALRNIGDRYRELLLARAQLSQIVSDPQLNPFPEEPDHEVALDKLREKIKFESRGANAFRVTYKDSDPDRARAVTEKLTAMLQIKDEEVRLDQATRTVEFATQQKESAAAELRKIEQQLAEFLAKHPEFAQDANTANTEGASIRAMRNQKATQTGNPRLYALERQRQRIQARLDAPPDAPPIRIVSPPSPERTAAEANARDAQRELGQAERQLDDAMTRFTDRHPEVIKARARVTLAQQKLRAAQAAIPPIVEHAVAPTTKEDREKLERELANLERQISTEQQRSGKGPGVEGTTNWIVRLETEHANLRREVNEQRERVESLAAAVFRAQIDASQKIAEQGGRLSVVDPAFRPVRPSGPGKMIFMLAGIGLFLVIGLGLAVGLAVVDDRVYRRGDLDLLGIPVLSAIPAARTRAREAKRPKRPKQVTKPARAKESTSTPRRAQ